MGIGPISPEVEQDRTQRQSWLKSWGPAALVTTVFVLLAARLFYLTSQYAVNVFFWDEWDLKDFTLFERHSLWQIFFQQFGWHRIGLGGWFEKVVDPLFKWNSRSESFILVAVLTVAAACALWLKARLAGGLSIFDIAIPAIFFTPAQWETLYMTPIFSQGPLPLLLIVVYCLTWTCGNKAVRYPLVVLADWVTTYTGFGLFVGVLTPVLLILDRWSRPPSERVSARYFTIALALSLLCVGFFFVGYQPTGGINCYSQFRHPISPKRYVGFMAIMAANFFAIGSLRSFPRFIGKTVLAVLLVVLVYSGWRLVQRRAFVSKQEQKNRLIVTAVVGLSLLSCATISYVRLCAGLVAALAPRYTVYLQLGMFGLYLHFLNIDRLWARRALLTTLAGSVLAACWHVDRSNMAFIRDVKQRWRACYSVSGDIKRCDQESGFVIGSAATEAHMAEKLQYLKKMRLNMYADAE